MTETGFSMKRVWKVILMLLLSIFLPVICGMIHGARLDDQIIWVFVSLIFYLCTILYMEHERLHEELSMGLSNDYSLLTFIYLVSLVAACVFSFLPAFFAPVMAISALCNGAFKSKMGTILAIYFSVLTAVFSGGRDDVLMAYVLVTIAGAFLVEFYFQEELRIWTNLILMGLSVVIPVCCYYLGTHEFNMILIIVALAGSFLTMLIMNVIIPKLRSREVITETISLDTIMDDSYHLKKEIHQYSQVDYDHAVKTAIVAERMAKELGADEKLAKAGGFYYRIGKLEGEPFIENGVQLAQKNCFSQRLIAILEEYNGVNKLPSSIESALVQIADTLVTKFDLLDKDTFASGWNRDIVIYQTMNEKSAEGLYDRSGLTMNQFLKIRELLVKEVSLL